jgi:hypothetical protein
LEALHVQRQAAVAETTGNGLDVVAKELDVEHGILRRRAA